MKMCFGIPRWPSLNSNGAWGFVSGECHSFGRISTDMLWVVMSGGVRTTGLQTGILLVNVLVYLL